MNLLEQFLNVLTAQNPAPSRATVKNYKADIAKFIRWFEAQYKKTFDPSEVNLHTIDAYKVFATGTKEIFKHEQDQENVAISIQTTPGQGLALKSFERHLSSLRKFFNFLKVAGHITTSPFELNLSSEGLVKEDPYHLKDFKDHMYVFNASDLTIKNYIIDIKQFLNWAQQVLGETITQDHEVFGHVTNELLHEYKQRLYKEAGLSPLSVNRKLSSLRRFITWATAEGYIKSHHNITISSAFIENGEKENTANPLENTELLHVPTNSDQKNGETKMQTNSNESDPVLTTPHYSNVPPIRLIQKISRIFSSVLEGILIAPLAALALKAHLLSWTITRASVFKKSAEQTNLGVGEKLLHIANKPFAANPLGIIKIQNFKKEFYAPLAISTASMPLHKKVWHHARHTRPNWYRRYHENPIVHYFHFAILVIVMTSLGVGMYQAFINDPALKRAQAAPNSPPRILSFQGRLTDVSDNPITTAATPLRFAIYNDVSATGGALLWQEVDSVSPDADGIFSILLGENTTIPQNLFGDNQALWIGITVQQTPELTPRQQIATVPYATNSELLQGMAPITQVGAGTTNVVLALDSSGNLSIGGSANPVFQATGGSLTLSGTVLNLVTATGSNGNVQIVPDGSGLIDLQHPVFNSTTGNNHIDSAIGSVEVDDLFSILATSSGQSALTINQNGTGPIISASVSGVAKFTVANSGQITDAAYTTAGGILYGTGTGLIAQTAAGTSSQCLVGGATPAFSDCSSYWDLANGALFPKNTTVDLLIGGTGSSAAKFAVLNVNAGTPTASVSAGTNGATYMTADGNIVTTAKQSLTLGGSTTGNINIGTDSTIRTITIGNSTGATGVAVNTGTGNFTVNSNQIFVQQSSGNIGIGTTTVNSFKLELAGSIGPVTTNTYDLGSPSLQWNNIYGNNIYSNGQLLSSLWDQANGVIFPKNSTVDFLIGGTSTASAKFALLNVSNGTPTASVSAGVNGAAYLSADGILATTAKESLTLGAATTGNINIGTDATARTVTIGNSTGASGVAINTGTGNFAVNSSQLYVNQTSGNVGIGISAPVHQLQVVRTAVDSQYTGYFDGQNSSNYGLYVNIANTTSNRDILTLASGGTTKVVVGGGGNVGIGTTTPLAKLDVNGAASASGSLTFRGGAASIVATQLGDLTLGDTNTGKVIVNPSGNIGLGTTNTSSFKIEAGGSLGPDTNNAYDLGSLALQWNNIYGSNFYSNGQLLTSYWDQLNGALLPKNSTVDLLIGGVSTASADFAILNVNGSGPVTATVSGNLIVMAKNAAGGNVGIGTTAPTSPLSIVSTLNPAGSDIYSVKNVTTTTTAFGSNAVYGGYFQTDANTSGTANKIVGLAGLASNAGANTISNAYGISAGVEKNSTGTITDARAIYSYITNGNGSNTIGSSYGFYTELLPNAGTITNTYGVYVGDITTGTQPNTPYSFYASDNNTYNYFAGNVGIANTAPIEKLDITGNATASGNLTLSGAARNVQTTNFNTLTIGGASTGNIILSPKGGSGDTRINGTTTLNGITYTWPGSQGSNYILQTNGTGTLSWADPASLVASATYWDQANGALYPKNATLDLLVGGVSSAAAKFAVLNVNSGTPTASVSAGINGGAYLTADGTLATTTKQTLTLGASTTGNINIGTDATARTITVGNSTGATAVKVNTGTGNFSVNTSQIFVQQSTGNVGIGITTPLEILHIAGNATASGNLTLSGAARNIQTTAFNTLTIGGASTGDIILSPKGGSGNIVLSNLTTSGGVLYTDTTGTIKSTSTSSVTQCLLGGTTPTWGSCASGGDANWTLDASLGLLYNNSTTVDLTIGGASTASAKFAVLNINSGTPTASVSSGVNGTGMFMTADGTLSTTKRQTLTIGNSSTYNTTGNVLINPNGTGNVGIGITNPNSFNFEVGGTTRFDGNTTIGDASGDSLTINAATLSLINASTLDLVNSQTSALNIEGGLLNFDTSNSRIGIGRTAPTMKLDVAGSATFSGTLSLGPTLQIDAGTCNQSSAGKIYYDPGNNYYYCNASSWTQFGAGTGTNWFNMTNGILYPINSTLDFAIGGQSTSSAKFSVLNMNSGTPIASIAGNFSLGSIAGTIRTIGATAMNALQLGDATTGDLIFAPANSTAVTVKTGGNVGIGTTTPAYSLEVVGSARVTSLVVNPTTGTTQALANFSNTGGFFYVGRESSTGGSVLTGSTAYASVLSSQGTAPIQFGVNNAIAMTIQNGGNVGIGATSPLAKLDVRGTLGTAPVASFSANSNSFAGMVINQDGLGALLTASTSGLTRFIVTNLGDVIAKGQLQMGNYTTAQASTLNPVGRGALYYNTDLSTLFISNDGTTWTSLSGQDTVPLTNQTSGSIAQYSIVILDLAHDSSFVSTTSAYDKHVIGVTNSSTCAASAVCLVTVSGKTTVRIANNVNRGDYLYTSSTAGQAIGSSAQHDGMLGVALTSGTAGGTVDVELIPQLAVNATATIDRGSRHNEYRIMANLYTGANTGVNPNTNLPPRGLVFDNFLDNSKIGTNSGTGGPWQATDVKGTAPYRVGLANGQTLSTSTSDNNGQTYLGSNTVNKIYYYDRNRDSSPAVQVNLGIDPNWPNGVTLGVASTSANFSQNDTNWSAPLEAVNPNLSTTYNGSNVLVTGQMSTSVANPAKTVYMMVKSTTASTITFDWSDGSVGKNGNTVTFGQATQLATQGGTNTGVFVTFMKAAYNTGDVFRIASWYIENTTGSTTRGGKAQFPERSYVVAEGSAGVGAVDIVDADTQKLWMRFSTGHNNLLYSDTDRTPSSVTMLNGSLYTGFTGGNLIETYFTTDSGRSVYTTGSDTYGGSLARRNSAIGFPVSPTTTSITTAATNVNDVAAAVIPNQPRGTVTVSGWGYIAGAAVDGVSELVNLPYKFTTPPNIAIAGGGDIATVPVTATDCNTASAGNIARAIGTTTSTFTVSVYNRTAASLTAGRYYCYSWTATGEVSPRQYVAVATGTRTAAGGVTIINETDQTSVNGSRSSISDMHVAIANGDLYYSYIGTVNGENYIAVKRGIPGTSAWDLYTGADAFYDRSNAGVALPTGLRTGPIIMGKTSDLINSLTVTPGTSTIDGKSNTIYVGTNVGLSVIQEKTSGGAAGDDGDQANGSVKNYMKDYISEEMVGDIRGMWPISHNTAASGGTVLGQGLADASYLGDSLTNNGSATYTSGVRGMGASLNGTTQYFSCTDANCGGTTKTDIGTAKWSLGAWIKTSNAGARKMIISKGSGTGSNFSYDIEVNASNVAQFYLFNTADATYITTSGTSTLTDGNWHYIVGTWNPTGTTQKVYVDGRLEGTSTSTSGSQVTDSTAAFEIGRRADNTGFFNGTIDEPMVTATELSASQIQHMYNTGYRALQSHSTALGSGSIDLNQQVAGTASMSADAKPDFNNQFMYVSTSDTNNGRVSKIDLNSDTLVKTMDSTANVPTGGSQPINHTNSSLAVGYNLEAVSASTAGVMTMAPDDNANGTSGSFLSKIFTTAETFSQAYIWVQASLDSQDASNSMTISASNDGGTSFSQCNLSYTDSSQTPPEYEYYCQLNTPGNSLQFKAAMTRGSTKTTSYITRYGVAWLDNATQALAQAGNGFYTNTNSTVASGSYIEVAHNQGVSDLLTNGWVFDNGVWKQVNGGYTPAYSWDGKDNQRTDYHQELSIYSPTSETDQYSADMINKGLLFDTFEDSTKTDASNSATAILQQYKEDDNGGKTLSQINRVQKGRVGLTGGMVYNTTNTDSASNAYLGSATVNKIFYYDRPVKDSKPEVLVNLGIDPNWANGVTLSVGTSSANMSQNDTNPNQRVNPNLSTSYNGSLLQVQGRYTSNARSIFVTINSASGSATFNWNDYNGNSGSNVTMTPGQWQSLSPTGVSVKFTGGVTYNTGDVFTIASWLTEPTSSTRGSKQSFPERSYIIATNSGVDIIDADTQKLWMRFTANNSQTGYITANASSVKVTSVTALNGHLYAGTFGTGGSAAGFNHIISFDTDSGVFQAGNNGTWRLGGSISQRNSGLTINQISSTAPSIVVNNVNDVAAAVIPNQPKQIMTVSGWGYVLGDGVLSFKGDTVRFPYKFNTVPTVTVAFAGDVGTAPKSLADCSSSGANVKIHAQNYLPTTSGSSVLVSTGDATAMSVSYYCYSWTATGEVSPHQYEAVATGSPSTNGGTTIINDTDQTSVNVSIGSQSAGNERSGLLALASDGSLYIVREGFTTDQYVIVYYGIGGLTASEATVEAYRSGYYGIQKHGWVGVGGPTILGAASGVTIRSISVTNGTSTIDGKSNTLYFSSDAGVTVLQEKQSHANYGDRGMDENSGSTKYYTKDYTSEEMVGDIRGMWPLSSNGAISLSDASIKANTLTNNNGVTAVTGVRGVAANFVSASSQYLSCSDASCGGTSKLDIGSGAWSVGAWIKTSTTGTRMMVLSKGGTSTQYSYNLEVTTAATGICGSDNIATFFLVNAANGVYSSVCGYTKVTDGKWHYLTATWNPTGTTTKLYVDGRLESSTTSTSGALVTDSSNAFEIGRRADNVAFFNGQIDEPMVTANEIPAGKIQQIYETGYRALQSHNGGQGSTGADTNQQLGGTVAFTADAKPDYNNQFMYVSTSDNSTSGAGRVSKIDLASDTLVKTIGSSSNIPSSGNLTVNNTNSSLAVGYDLEAVSASTAGVMAFSPTNSSYTTSANYLSKVFPLPQQIASAVVWVKGWLDSSDSGSSLTVSATANGGVPNTTYDTCTLVSTDTSGPLPEKEYACDLSSGGSNLQMKFAFARSSVTGGSSANNYITEYGVSWLGQNGFKVEQTTNNTVRLYNYSGITQNLRLDVITGVSNTSSGFISLAPNAADVDSGSFTNSIWINKTGDGGTLLKLQKNGTDVFTITPSYLGNAQTATLSANFNPGTDNTYTLGSSPSARWKDLYLGPSSLHILCKAGDGAGCGSQTLDWSMGADTSTGNFQIMANGTSSNNTAKLVINQAGNVGIGTTTPSLGKLQVGTPGGTGSVASSVYYDVDSTSYFLDPAATGTSLSVAGNIGIGSTNPTSPLYVTNTHSTGVSDFIGNYTDITQSVSGGITTYAYRAIGRATHTSGTLTGLQVNSTQGYFSGGGTTSSGEVLTAIADVSGSGTTVNTLNLLKIFGSSVGSGSTVGTLNGIYIAAPSVSGTVTNKYALVTEANAGNVGIGDITPNSPLTVGANDAFQVSSTGHVGMGASPIPHVGIYLQSALSGSTGEYGTITQPTFDSAATSLGIAALFQAITANSSFTQAATYGVYIANATKGAASTITTNYGLYVESPTAGTTNYAAIFAGGNVGIGTGAPSASLQITTAAASTTAFKITDATNYTLQAGYHASGVGYIGGLTGSQLALYANNAEKVRIDLNGNVGIGNTAPSQKLFVLNSVTNDWTTVIENTANATNAHGLYILAGSDSSAGAHQITFHRHDGTEIGSISQASATTVQYTTTSDIRQKENIIAASKGLVDLLNIEVADYNFIKDPEKTKQTGFLAQQLYTVFPDAVYKPINPDDNWSVDYGRVTPLIVKSVQELNGKVENNNALTIASNSAMLTQVHSELSNVYAALSASQGTASNSASLVTLTEAINSLNISTTDFISISANATPSGTKPYMATDSFGKVFTNAAAYSQAAIANLKAGMVDAKELKINGQTLQAYIISVIQNAGFIQPTVVAPIAQIDRVYTNTLSPLASGGTITIDGNLAVNGNATISGRLTAQTIQTETATIGGTLTANKVEGQDGIFNGTLRARNIVADNIEGLQATIATMAAHTITNITNVYQSTPSGSIYASDDATHSALLAALATLPNGQYATYSGTLSNLAAVSADFGTFNQGLIALGPSSFTDVSVAGQFSIGGSMIFVDNSINTLGSDLSLQPLRQGGISIMGGLIHIDTDGNVNFGGTATFAKDIRVNGKIIGSVISPIPDEDMVIALGTDGLPTTSQFKIKNSSGSAVFAVNQTGDVSASGSGTFTKLNLTLVKQAVATGAGDLLTFGTAGVATISATRSEITIHNSYVTKDSLIYITPVGTPSAQTTYLLRQKPGESFSVGGAANSVFNWLIVN